jgi:hypothetical protein
MLAIGRLLPARQEIELVHAVDRKYLGDPQNLFTVSTQFLISLARAQSGARSRLPSPSLGYCFAIAT